MTGNERRTTLISDSWRSNRLRFGSVFVRFLSSSKVNLKTHFPHASKDFVNLNCSVPATISKRDDAPTLVKASKGAGQIRGRIGVRYTGCFVRPQDADNLAGATKICSDTLRAIGLLPNDDPYSIELSWRQRKVKHFADERLEIEITL